MLIVIPVVTCLLFGAIYPLCFWLVGPQAIQDSFRKFNLGMTNFVSGLGVVVLFFLNVPLEIKLAVLGWKIFLLSVSSYLWKKPKMNLWLMTAPCLVGIYTAQIVIRQFSGERYDFLAMSAVILGGAILCLSLFVMILGHWYLNVSGLPISYLTRASKVFWAFLCARVIWDTIASVTQHVNFMGDSILLFQFFGHVEGFFLSVAIFFGAVLPALLMYFVMETIKVKSTQSATGMLYVILIAVLMGDLAYKYYFFKFNLAL